MSFDLADVPLWAAIPAAVFVVLGALLTLIGTMGLVRLTSFYERIHAPTLGTSWGVGGMVMGSMIVFLASGARPILHELLIGVFVTLTTPITLMLLGRAALYRDRMEKSEEVPPFPLAPEPSVAAPDGDKPAQGPSERA